MLRESFASFWFLIENQMNSYQGSYSFVANPLSAYRFFVDRDVVLFIFFILFIFSVFLFLSSWKVNNSDSWIYIRNDPNQASIAWIASLLILFEPYKYVDFSSVFCLYCCYIFILLYFCKFGSFHYISAVITN